MQNICHIKGGRDRVRSYKVAVLFDITNRLNRPLLSTLWAFRGLGNG